jgi:sugar phosphate isomerase/epimerase
MLLTQDKPFFPQSWVEKFKTAKSMGFDGFEIDGKALLERFDEIKQALSDSQFKVYTICGGYRGWIGDFDESKRKTCLSDIEHMLYLGSTIGVRGIVVPAAWGMFSKRLPPMTPPRSDEDDRQILLDSLSFLDRVAEQTKTTIFLEPLNRYEDHMLNCTQDAYRLIKDGGFRHVKICYDFFHMNIEESQMDEPILKYHELIGHIHLASSHRYQPDTGHLDYHPGLSALKKIGYDQLFAIECRVLGDDLLDAYTKACQYTQELLKSEGLYHV